MIITNAQYYVNLSGDNVGVMATIDGVQMAVPINLENIHYVEIKKQVDAGTLTIKDAD